VPEMRSCPHCRAENSVKRRVCFRCGQALVPGGSLAAAPAPEPSRAARPRAEALRGGLFWTRAATRFFRSWANLIHSGLTVAESLRNLERHGPQAYRDAVGEMAAQTESGGAVAEAMAGHPRLFLRWQVALVRAGEAAGALEEVVEEIASDLEGEYAMRRELLGRTWHFWVATIPGILVFLPVGITLAGPMPEGGWDPLALVHRILFYFLRTTVPLGGMLIGGVLGNRLASRSVRWRERREAFNLRLPLLGTMLRRAALSRFYGSLALLLRAGVPIAAAMEIAADASGNEAMAARLRETGERLRSGFTLTEALADTGVSAGDDLRILATGEESGQAPDALGRVADWYGQETEHDRRRYPLLIQLVGYAILVPFVGLVAYLLARGMWLQPFKLWEDLHGF